MSDWIRHSFDRAAPGYDRHAGVQQEISNRLLERLDFIRLAPAVVVDLGAGTGSAAQQLATRYPDARILAADFSLGMLRQAQEREGVRNLLACDARALPFAKHCVDLVFSSSTLQWCEPLEEALACIHHSLRPDGLFLFSSYGPDTLRELRAAQEQAGIEGSVNIFRDMHPVGDMLREQGFRDPVLDVEHLEVGYDSPMDLLLTLRGIGSVRTEPGYVMSRRKWKEMLDAYPRQADGTIRATYEVVYGYARGAEKGVTTVPISALERPGS